MKSVVLIILFSRPISTSLDVLQPTHPPIHQCTETMKSGKHIILCSSYYFQFHSFGGSTSYIISCIHPNPYQPPQKAANKPYHPSSTPSQPPVSVPSNKAEMLSGFALFSRSDFNSIQNASERQDNSNQVRLSALCWPTSD